MAGHAFDFSETYLHLMSLLFYITMGEGLATGRNRNYPKIPVQRTQEERDGLSKLVEDRPLTISSKMITVIPPLLKVSIETIIEEKSRDADLYIIGFYEESVKHDGTELFQLIHELGNISYVNPAAQKMIIEGD